MDSCDTVESALMRKAIVTGSGGLIGSGSAERLVKSDHDVIGIENDTRAVLLGAEAAIASRELDWKLDDDARIGDHRWWISSLDEFGFDYGGWGPKRGLEMILTAIREASTERWES